MVRSWNQTPTENDEWSAKGTAIHDAIYRNTSSDLKTDEDRVTYSKLVRKLNMFLDYWGAGVTDEIFQEKRF